MPKVTDRRKERQVLTCIPCKQRKVKCDKQRPQCGPCRRSRAPAQRCHYTVEDRKSESPTGFWVLPAEPSNPTRQAEASGSTPARSENGRTQPHDENGRQSTHETHNTSELLDRIARLEALAQRNHTVSTYPNGSDTRTYQHTPPELAFAATPAPPAFFPFSDPQQASPHLVRSIIASLPSEDDIRTLLTYMSKNEVTLLFAPVSWRLVWMQVDPLLENLRTAQHDDFDTSTIDFSFLAVVIGLIASSTRFPTDQTFTFVDQLSHQARSELQQRLYRSAETCLVLAEFTDKPNLSVLVALCILRDDYATQKRSTTYYAVLALTIKLAQVLQMHRLGSAKDDEQRWKNLPPHTGSDDFRHTHRGSAEADEATSRVEKSMQANFESAMIMSRGNDRIKLQPGLPERSHLVHEAARKIWYQLVAQDYYSASSFEPQQPYQVMLQHCNVALPLNVDEDDLPNGDGVYGLPSELPDGYPNYSVGIAWQHKTVLLCRDIADAQMSAPLTFQDVRKWDERWRALIDTLPVYLRFDGISEKLPYIVAAEGTTPLVFVRGMLNESINHRLLLLHRSYILRGLREEEMASSTRRAVKAALLILANQSDLRTKGKGHVMQWYAGRLHAWNACLALCVFLIGKARLGHPPTPQTESVRAAVSSALSFIASHGNTSHAQEAQNSASKFLDRLLHTELTIREADLAPTASNHVVPVSTHSTTPAAMGGVSEPPIPFNLAPDDPLSVYMSSLLDPSITDTVSPPPNFFDVLQNYFAQMESSR